MVFVGAIVSSAVIPFGTTAHIFGRDINLYATDLNVGALFVMAISGISVYGIILGAWASANRFSLLGGLRSAAQVVSYELILGLSLTGIFLLAGSLSLRDIVLEQQQNLSIGPIDIKNWYIFSQPLAFVIFLIAAVAETNRAPFDLPEAETELISGFHTEYSAFRFSFYFLGEYIAMIVISLFASTLFLGGPARPRIGPATGGSGSSISSSRRLFSSSSMSGSALRCHASDMTNSWESPGKCSSRWCC